ncbi:MAG: hypothetical protein FWF60_02315, partial [Oscillospiraceae bacterium]|nr:hypothetical protein [Oscillospiraceae bacterium]
VEKLPDYRRACKGFTVNGVKYTRLVGTNGGVKTKTIVFVSERLAPELCRRMDNGRDRNAPHVPAKLEAYKALACSATTAVSMPRGILVVPDCETEFVEDVITISDNETGEPKLEYVDGATVKLNESDGYGLICPALAARWSEELGLGYASGGFNTRFSFEKGMVFAFDFHRFAGEIAGTGTVKDIWDNDVDVAGVELILTASMLKLWSSYSSCEHYLRCCAENGYSFCVTKACPEKLESWRNTNYQFLQSYELDDEDIAELIQPTVDRIRDVINGDWRKAALFLGGDRQRGNENAFCTALSADPRMHDDPFIRDKLLRLIQGEIDDAKIGALGVHGNYSIVSGDPYSLCQHIFGLPVTGLLRAGEIYSQYWADLRVPKAVVMRAPMTCHNNIRVASLADCPEIRGWYAHMPTCTVINSWDSMAHALNGMDKDGDMVFITDNPVLLRRSRPTRTILCAQRVAEKIRPAEDDLVRSNINGFGDDIGKITNRITAMFDVRSQFEPGSAEYEELSYRIMCGQHFQQCAIDKTKGIQSSLMPKHWYDRRAADEMDDGELREFNLRIVANKKPYFMRYIYPVLMREYNAHLKNTNGKSVMEFRRRVSELAGGGDGDEQDTFRHYADVMTPVSNLDCVTNRICRMVEGVFSDKVELVRGGAFDAGILRGGTAYSKTHFREVKKIYEDFRKYWQAEAILAKQTRRTGDDILSKKAAANPYFRSLCYGVCSNEDALLDILIDLCYTTAASKQFVWDMALDALLARLLRNAGGMTVKFTECGENEAEVAWCGKWYKAEWGAAQAVQV